MYLCAYLSTSTSAHIAQYWLQSKMINDQQDFILSGDKNAINANQIEDGKVGGTKYVVPHGCIPWLQANTRVHPTTVVIGHKWHPVGTQRFILLSILFLMVMAMLMLQFHPTILLGGISHQVQCATFGAKRSQH